MARCDLSCGDRRLSNGNCPDPADDGLPVQCVGPWVAEKHGRLDRYIKATRGPRKNYLLPLGRGGAAYIDLFAGPGRARDWSTGALVDGSPLIALRHLEAPFSKLVLCERDPENAKALRARTGHDDRVVVIEGDCHERIDDIIEVTPSSGLNFALIDPFSLDQLRFDTLAMLARVQRMDLLIHLPTMDIKRNFGRGMEAKLTRALGTDGWKKYCSKPAGIARWAVEALRTKLAEFGYTGKEVPTPLVTNTKSGGLYHLVFASKHDLGDKIWRSIARSSGSGQGSLPF